MKILNIKKIGYDRYEIKLESGQTIKTYDTILLKYHILLKKEIKEELLESVIEETREAALYEKVIRFLNKKMRSEKEVKEFLKKEQVTDIDAMMERLKSMGMFQNSRYIEAYIHDHFTLANDGPLKIKHDLLELGFDLVDIDLELQKIEDRVSLKLSRLIDKKLKQNHKYSEKYCKQKILEQMVLLGYPKELVQTLLEEKVFVHDSILENVAIKLYQKYKNKKEGDELWLLLKQKLYQKQYPKEEIEHVLEEIQKKDLS